MSEVQFEPVSHLIGMLKSTRNGARVMEMVRTAGARVALFATSLREEDGQGAVEYSLVVLAVAAIIAAGIAGFTGQITSFMSAAGTQLASYV